MTTTALAHGHSAPVRALFASLAVGTACLAALPLAACGGGSHGGDSTGPAAPDAAVYSLSAARAEHTVTALSNGDLLIAGGTGSGGSPLSSTEVFDASEVPAGTPVVTAGPLNVPRTRHTATRLASGNVVAIGGTASAAVEQFTPDLSTPSNGTWAVAVPAVLATPRSRHGAALLLDGRVLVCGGISSAATTLASAELYVNAASPFAAATAMNVARRDHTATLLPDGRVLVAGGYDAAGLPLSSAEVYDPVGNTWTVVGPLGTARALHAATLMNAADVDPTNDRVLVTGGAGAAGAGVRAAELYDPATNLFTGGGDLEGPGVFDHAAVLLANGQVGIVGGFTTGGGAAPDDPVRETIVYRFGSGQGVGAQDAPARRGALRAGAIASAGPAGSDVVIVGGADESGTPRNGVYLLAIDDEATALADTLSDEDALALGVIATAFHLFEDGLTGIGDVDLAIEDDPVFGRMVIGSVGNFDVDLQVDAGSVVGDVEGKNFVLDVASDVVTAPDFVVDFTPSDRVAGDFDVDFQDFDFDVDRDADTFAGWITGWYDEAYLRIEVLGDQTDAGDSYLDVYWI